MSLAIVSQAHRIMPRVHGTVTTWKGQYGFVTHPDHSTAVFLHISDMEQLQWPQVGTDITYNMAIDPKNGKPRAYSARVDEPTSPWWNRTGMEPSAPATYHGHAVTDIIKISRRIMSVLRHEDARTWLTAQEIMTKMPPNKRCLVSVALEFDKEQPTARQHFTGREKTVEEFQAIHTKPRRQRDTSRSPRGSSQPEEHLDYDIPSEVEE